MTGFRVWQLENSHLWAIGGVDYYSPKLNAAARSVPGTRWDPKLKAQIGYIDAIEQVVARMREYKLRTQDTPENKRQWKHNLLVSYEGAREYQKEGIDFLINQARSGALLADDMGCLAASTTVNFIRNREKLCTASLAELYRMFTEDGGKGIGAVYEINALCGTELSYQPIRAVIHKGWWPVLKLKFTSGAELRLTPDHEVGLASNTRPVVFERADSLQRGDRVIAGTHFGDPDEDEVVSIEQDGEAHVYDIVCEDPHRNFVANGIVVHNCGKSLQAVKAARALRRKTVIVCPAHVRGVWERPADARLGEKGGELAKWWSDATVFAPYGTKPKPIPDDANVFVTHYDIVHAWVEAILDWTAIDDDEASEHALTAIFDEAHILLNPTTRRSKACREIAEHARGRIGLSGTPPVERVKDLYNVVETISPGRFGDFFPYGIRYCGGQKIDVPIPGGTTKTVWSFEGKSHLKELRQRLDWFCLRRTKREVLKELPAMQRQVVDIDVPPKNRIAMNARLVGDKRRMRMALDSAADGKFKSVLEIVRAHLEAGQRVVVGTYRRAVCEKFADLLGEFAPTRFIHGGVPLPRRGKITDELKRTEGPCCLVANIDCTSTGIDLTFASVGVIAELVWEPRELAQWEARLHRYGQEESVLIEYIIARGTGDELILHAVINKLDNHLELVETDKGDGMKETLKGEDDGLARLAKALKKMGRNAT